MSRKKIDMDNVWVHQVLEALVRERKLESEEIGTWYARAKTADVSASGNSVGVIYEITRDSQPASEVEIGPLFKPVKRDASLPKIENKAVELVFTFRNLGDLASNLDAFTTFATAEIKRQIALRDL